MAALFRNVLRYTSGNSSRYRRRAIPSSQSSSNHWSDTITSSSDQQIPLDVGLPSPPIFAPPASLTLTGIGPSTAATSLCHHNRRMKGGYRRHSLLCHCSYLLSNFYAPLIPSHLQNKIRRGEYNNLINCCCRGPSPAPSVYKVAS